MSKKFSQFNQATEPNFDEEVVGLQSGDNMRTKFPWRGPFDASVNQYPSTGGSGPSGAIFSGDSWYASVGGTISGITVNAGDLIICLVSTPGQTASNWKISKSAADAWPLSGSAALTDDVIISGAFDLSFIVDRLIVTMDDGVDFGELNIDPDAFNFLSSGYVTMISDDGTNYNEITVNPNGINLDVSDGVDTSMLTLDPDLFVVDTAGDVQFGGDGGFSPYQTINSFVVYSTSVITLKDDTIIQLIAPITDIRGSFCNREISPAEIQANTNNYNPAVGSFYYLTSDGDYEITGWVPTQGDGDTRIIYNGGSFTLIFTHNDTGNSTAANCFTVPGGSDLPVGPGKSVTWKYSTVTDRWIMTSTTV